MKSQIRVNSIPLTLHVSDEVSLPFHRRLTSDPSFLRTLSPASLIAAGQHGMKEGEGGVEEQREGGVEVGGRESAKPDGQ